jgi:hypothetical protein
MMQLSFKNKILILFSSAVCLLLAIKLAAWLFLVRLDGLTALYILFYLLIFSVFIVWLLGIILFAADKASRKYLIIYLIFGTMLFFARVTRVLPHYNILDNVFYGTALAPNLYRILVPCLSFPVLSLFPALHWLNAARIWNFMFILTAFPLFHKYLSKWFDARICFVLTLLLGFMMPLSFWYDYPDDFLDIIVFTLGFMWIRDKKDLLLLLLIPIASLNKETAVFLAAAYFISNVEKRNFIRVTLKSSAYFLVWLIPTIALRLIRGFRPYRSDLFTLPENVTSVIYGFLLYNSRFFDLLLFIFVFLIIYYVFRQEKEDVFLKRNLITALFIFIVSCNVALMYEIRIFYPILPIMIPLAFYPLFGNRQ